MVTTGRPPSRVDEGYPYHIDTAIESPTSDTEPIPLAMIRQNHNHINGHGGPNIHSYVGSAPNPTTRMLLDEPMWAQRVVDPDGDSETAGLASFLGDNDMGELTPQYPAQPINRSYSNGQHQFDFPEPVPNNQRHHHHSQSLTIASATPTPNNGTVYSAISFPEPFSGGPTGLASPFVSDIGSKRWPDPLQRRRASHNAVERRRRDTITEKIRELGTLIPEDFKGDAQLVANPNERNHKSVVLRRGVNYVRHLQDELDVHRRNELALQRRVSELERALTNDISPVPIIKQEEDLFGRGYASPSPTTSTSDFDSIQLS